MADILSWCGDHPIVLDFVPEINEIRKVPKQWLINLVYSLVGNKFKSWVRDQIESRNTKLTVEKDIMIKLDPKIAAVFHNSSAVSSK